MPNERRPKRASTALVKAARRALIQPDQFDKDTSGTSHWFVAEATKLLKREWGAKAFHRILRAAQQGHGLADQLALPIRTRDFKEAAFALRAPMRTLTKWTPGSAADIAKQRGDAAALAREGFDVDALRRSLDARDAARAFLDAWRKFAPFVQGKDRWPFDSSGLFFNPKSVPLKRALPSYGAHVAACWGVPFTPAHLVLLEAVVTKVGLREDEFEKAMERAKKALRPSRLDFRKRYNDELDAMKEREKDRAQQAVGGPEAARSDDARPKGNER